MRPVALVKKSSPSTLLTTVGDYGILYMRGEIPLQNIGKVARTVSTSKRVGKRVKRVLPVASCQLDLEIPEHGLECPMEAAHRLRSRGKAKPLGRRLTGKELKERRLREALAAGRYEHEHGPAKREVLVMASDMEEAMERALELATVSDWRLKAAIPNVKGVPMVTALPGNWYRATVMVKRPAPKVDFPWH